VNGETNKMLCEKKSEIHKNGHFSDGKLSCDKGVNNRRHKKRIHLVTKPSDVWLHRDGRVHEISFLDTQNGNDRTVTDGMQDTAPSRPIASSVEKVMQ
jgi:hypothetical protein